ncbi:MAG: xanthine dehydrogenase family protein subunit M [Desulfobacterota bacterium]|nr:xanthine dehydrogenase family protein subunit M [Thermodesulfobacteriota bacterium]
MIPPFQYSLPKTLSEACQLLWDASGRAKVIAGGTDLVISLRNGGLTPSCLVDLTHLKELRGIEVSNGGLSIGAAVSHSEIASSPTVRQFAGILSEAASQIGSPQIRNLGTLGGNIVNASPAADTLPPLLVLEAVGRVVSLKGERDVPVSRLLLGPYRTALQPYEILTRISFKKIPEGMRWVFIRLARREAMAIARMSLALLLRMDGGRIEEVRIAPGAVLPHPDRLIEVEEFLKGKTPEEALLKEASKKVSEAVIRRSGIRPSTSYKAPVLEALFLRAMREVLQKDS